MLAHALEQLLLAHSFAPSTPPTNAAPASANRSDRGSAATAAGVGLHRRTSRNTAAARSMNAA
jgi:hypothetical protein